MWDIAVPSGPGLPGVTMAGFRWRGPDPVDLQVVPYPAVTLVVDLSPEPLVVDHAGGRHRGSLVAGLTPGTMRGRGRDVECVQVRLSPVVAPSLLGGAAPELSGTMVGLADLWGGAAAARLQEQLRAAPTWSDRFALVEAALARGPARPVDPEVAFAWAEMVGSQGQVRVDPLAVEVGWSRKRLWARFRAQVGLTPKRSAQLIRFDRAAHRLAAGTGAAQVAAEGGYADQSHLHRDVLAFAGVTPTAVAVAPWLQVDAVAWAQ